MSREQILGLARELDQDVRHCLSQDHATFVFDDTKSAHVAYINNAPKNDRPALHSLITEENLRTDPLERLCQSLFSTLEYYSTPLKDRVFADKQQITDHLSTFFNALSPDDQRVVNSNTHALPAANSLNLPPPVIPAGNDQTANPLFGDPTLLSDPTALPAGGRQRTNSTTPLLDSGSSPEGSDDDQPQRQPDQPQRPAPALTADQKIQAALNLQRQVIKDQNEVIRKQTAQRAGPTPAEEVKDTEAKRILGTPEFTALYDLSEKTRTLLEYSENYWKTHGPLNPGFPVSNKTIRARYNSLLKQAETDEQRELIKNDRDLRMQVYLSSLTAKQNPTKGEKNLIQWGHKVIKTDDMDPILLLRQGKINYEALPLPSKVRKLGQDPIANTEAYIKTIKTGLEDKDGNPITTWKDKKGNDLSGWAAKEQYGKDLRSQLKGQEEEPRVRKALNAAINFATSEKNIEQNKDPRATAELKKIRDKNSGALDDATSYSKVAARLDPNAEDLRREKHHTYGKTYAKSIASNFDPRNHKTAIGVVFAVAIVVAAFALIPVTGGASLALLALIPIGYYGYKEHEKSSTKAKAAKEAEDAKRKGPAEQAKEREREKEAEKPENKLTEALHDTGMFQNLDSKESKAFIAKMVKDSGLDGTFRDGVLDAKIAKIANKMETLADVAAGQKGGVIDISQAGKGQKVLAHAIASHVSADTTAGAAFKAEHKLAYAESKDFPGYSARGQEEKGEPKTYLAKAGSSGVDPLAQKVANVQGRVAAERTPSKGQADGSESSISR
jgi:hypothetical protein